MGAHLVLEAARGYAWLLSPLSGGCGEVPTSQQPLRQLTNPFKPKPALHRLLRAPILEILTQNQLHTHRTLKCQRTQQDHETLMIRCTADCLYKWTSLTEARACSSRDHFLACQQTPDYAGGREDSRLRIPVGNSKAIHQVNYEQPMNALAFSWATFSGSHAPRLTDVPFPANRTAKLENRKLRTKC